MQAGIPQIGWNGGSSNTPPPTTAWWRLDGNTVGSEKFIGTIDNFDFPIRTNNVEVARFTTGGTLGIGTASPASSSLLDVTSTSKGVLVPRMTTVQRNAISSPATSLFVYDTSVSLFSYYDGATWQYLDSTASSEWLLNGNTVGSEKWIGTVDSFAFPFRTANTEWMRLTTAGLLGIGTTAPSTKLEVAANDATGVVASTVYSTTVNGGFTSRRSRGTLSSPSAVTISNTLGGISVQGYGETGFGSTATGLIAFNSAEAFTDSAKGTDMVLQLAPIGSVTPATVLTVLNSGLFGFNKTVPTALIHGVGFTSDDTAYAMKLDSSVASSIPIFHARNDGNCSIGQTVQSARLHIKTAGSNDILLLETSAGAVGAEFFNSGRVLFNSGGFDYTPDGAIDLKGAFAHFRLRKADSTVVCNLELSTNNTVFDNLAELIWRNASSVERMRLTTNGNFLIGTPTEQARFHNFGTYSTTGINQRLEPVSGVTEDTFGATENTTDATVTTLQTLAIPTDKAVGIECVITYRKTSGSGVGTTGDGTLIILTSSAKNVGGTVTLDTIQNTYTGTLIAGFAATLDVSTTNVRVRVTGATDDNVTWNVITKMYTV